MQIDIVRPAELGSADRARWQVLQSTYTHLDSPFLSPSFASAVGRARPGTRVAVVSDGAAAGYFPFERVRGGHGRALGMGFSDVQGLVAPQSLEVDAVGLLQACRLRSFSFDHLVAQQQGWLATGPSRFAQETSPVMDLSAGFDAYASDRHAGSKSLLASIARNQRKLERGHGPVRLVLHQPDHAVLEQVLSWKSQQYRRTGRRDLFANPAIRSLVHDLLDMHESTFSAPLSVLLAGETIVAAHFGLRSRATLAWWFPVYDPAFAVYSPGLMLCLNLARAVVDEGLSILDLGKGDEAYKNRLSNARIDLLSGSVAATRRTQALMNLRRWPYEQAMAMVLGSPRLRRASRSALARAGELRVRATSTHWSDQPVIANQHTYTVAAGAVGSGSLPLGPW